MNNLPLFLFGTPEGGSLALIEHLKADGYQVYNWPENQLLGFYDFADVIAKLGPQIDNPSDILINCLFPTTVFPEKAVIVDNHVGKDYGWGFRVWFALARAVPEVKMVFAHADFEYSLVRMLGVSRKWIPDYGTCPGNCEVRTKNQILQMQQFSTYWPKNSITYNLQTDDYSKISSFINS